MPINKLALALGGSIDFDLERARAIGRDFTETLLSRTPDQQPLPIGVDRADYSAAYNSTALTPRAPLDGVALPYGRCWAEVRSVTHSGGSGSVGVSLVSAQNGVRCIVTAPPGQTITGGSVRFWCFDPVIQSWNLGGVEETLATGAQGVATTDQFVTVGAH
jgi:hypothetical protein